MSEVTISNKALGWVGGNRITSLDTSIDTSIEAQLCSDAYPGARDVVIQEGGFNFATKRYKFTPMVTQPDWGYTYQFLVPAKVLRVLRVSDNQFHPDQGTGVPWRLEANENDSTVISCNAQVIYVKTIIRIIDTTKFSPLMSEALSARMAMDLAIPIKRSVSLQQTMAQLYNKKMQLAMGIDNMQGTSEKLTNSSLTDARLSGIGIGPYV